MPHPLLPASRSQTERGFTLIEVLIALSLVSLIMLGLVSALATFGTTTTRIENQVKTADEARLISSFLRETLGRVSSTYRNERETAKSGAMLRLANHQLTWLGVMPARHGVGGLHLMRLTLEPSDTGPALILQYLPYDGGGLDADWTRAARHDLLGTVTRFDVRVFGGKPVPAWHTEWDTEDLPETIAIDLAAGKNLWPSLLVRINAIAPADGGVRIVHGPVGIR